MRIDHSSQDLPRANAWNQRGSEMAEGLSTIGPIPYFPNLKRVVPNVTCALLVTYLEMRFPAPQGLPGCVSSLPVVVPLDTVREDLQISRRTLGLNLYAIARVYPEEGKRWRGVRAAREFLQPNHRAKGTIKLYSIVTDYNLERAHTIVLRRNLPFLLAAFAKCRISTTSLGGWEQCKLHSGAPPIEASRELTKVGCAPLLVTQPDKLAEILLRASQLSVDRRKLRYPRLRKAVASGLEDQSVLSAKQPKRKNKLTRVNEAVEPDLPDEVRARLISLREDEQHRF